MALIFKPPTPFAIPAGMPSVFLAGSIEMGLAGDWQADYERRLADLDVAILNPRRDEWDASWVQSIDNPQFRGQVEWELTGQEQATLIAMYFAPETKAPITLLELGLFAESGKVLVCAPRGYWRRGNIEVVAARYCVPLFESLEELILAVRGRIAKQ